jgi:NAD(P)-dependent dehydrogenase (short-subunit alcohol dehydrogenase family)
MDISNLRGKWALVTGGGSGIGRATALALARRGADLVICDIDESGLAETRTAIEKEGSSVIAVPVDVADREQMRLFAEGVHAEIPALDILVNNAGIGISGTLWETPLDEWERIVGINLMGVVHGMHFFVPPMVERGQGGHVVNISSMAGYTALGLLSAYNATKFAVRGLSEATRGELAMHDIGVTAICPGIINTPIVHNMRVYSGNEDDSRQQAVQAFSRRNYPPEKLAEGILAAIRKNKAVAPITLEARLFWKLTRWVPGLVHWINRKATERAIRDAAQSNPME